jgi:hypothetical protein
MIFNNSNNRISLPGFVSLPLSVYTSDNGFSTPCITSYNRNILSESKLTTPKDFRGKNMRSHMDIIFLDECKTKLKNICIPLISSDILAFIDYYDTLNNKQQYDQSNPIFTGICNGSIKNLEISIIDGVLKYFTFKVGDNGEMIRDMTSINNSGLVDSDFVDIYDSYQFFMHSEFQ